MLKKFSNTPNYKHDHDNYRYLGTWYYNDCYVYDSTLIIRYGDEPHQNMTCGNCGWNNYSSDSKVGGVGNGKNRCELDIEGIDGQTFDVVWAKVCALMVLGSEYLDTPCQIKGL